LTYELLVKIVAETIKRIELAKALRVFAFAFDDKNRDMIRKAASFTGDRLNFVDGKSGENMDQPEQCDIFFVDYLPSGLIPKLALGIDEAPFCSAFNRLVLNGSKIFVLKNDVAETEKTPPAFRELLASYRETLKSYGYVFFEQSQISPVKVPLCGSETRKFPEVNAPIFRESIFCREDLLKYAPKGTVILDAHVRITPQALDCAKDMNIAIRRLGENPC
jgi:hypothetical protein